MLKVISAFILASALFVGCATAGKMNKVQIGMTKSEVINAIGEPVSVSKEKLNI